MKKETISIIASMLILLISFQNCQKPPYADEIIGLNVNPPSANKVELGSMSITSVAFFVPESQNVTKAGNTYQINYNKTLAIELKSGKITETSDLNSATAEYCLDAALRDELVSILKSSQVCTLQPEIAAGIACTQVMKMPYAQLTTTNIQFDLGSASDGCGNNSVDLCDGQPAILKGFIEAVKKQYLKLICAG